MNKYPLLFFVLLLISCSSTEKIYYNREEALSREIKPGINYFYRDHPYWLFEPEVEEGINVIASVKVPSAGRNFVIKQVLTDAKELLLVKLENILIEKYNYEFKEDISDEREFIRQRIQETLRGEVWDSQVIDSHNRRLYAYLIFMNEDIEVLFNELQLEYNKE